MSVPAHRASEHAPDRTLPLWFRLVLVGTGAARLGFGLTLLLHPGAIASLWPWGMTSLAARLLGASTLVSAPLALGAAILNRWRAARIPVVMMLAYRVLQLVAGLIHYDRFDFGRPPTWNYFLGGTAMMLILAYVLLRGNALGSPARGPAAGLPEGPLSIGPLAGLLFEGTAAAFFGLGVFFMLLGPRAAPVWIEATGQLTPLTARLFASPMVGLAIGLWLTRSAAWWQEVVVPAVGLTIFGLAATFVLLVEHAAVTPATAASWVIVAAPAVLLIVGAYLLLPARRGGVAGRIASLS